MLWNLQTTLLNLGLPLNALMELIGNKFQSNECNTTSATATSDKTLRDIVQSELFRYKAEPSIAVDQCLLHWWAAHQHIYPNLCKMACKYLCVVATSVPYEQLFSMAGNVVSAKRSALLPENVSKLIVLHDNLPLINTLPHKRIQEEEKCNVIYVIEYYSYCLCT